MDHTKNVGPDMFSVSATFMATNQQSYNLSQKINPLIWLWYPLTYDLASTKKGRLTRQSKLWPAIYGCFHKWGYPQSSSVSNDWISPITKTIQRLLGYPHDELETPISAQNFRVLNYDCLGAIRPFGTVDL